MPANLQAPAAPAIPQDLYAVNGQPRGDDPFPEQEFVTRPNIPVFAEHTTKTRDGRELKFGYQELKAVADRCNRRIAETGDYATLAIGHNPDPQAKMMGAATPDAVGFVGPFRMGTIQGTDGQQKYAILADLHYFRDDWERAKKFARRSAELWVEDRYEEMFLDPIALLGAETPRLDLGLVYSRVHEGRAVEKYAAVFPGAMNVHVMDGPDEEENYQAEGSSMITPDDVKMIVDALSAMPQWQYLESMMAASEAEGGTQGGVNTVGDALPGGPPAVATPPAAPTGPAAPPTVPPAMPEPAAPPMASGPPSPPMPKAGPPTEESSGPPKPPAAAGPPSPPEKDKEKNAMAYQNACYAALDAMDDTELQSYMAQRYGAGAKSYAADGGSVPEGDIDADNEPSSEAGSYQQKPPMSDGSAELNTGGGPSPKKTEHTVTTYKKDPEKAMHYRLATVEAELAAVKKEREEEHHGRIDAERRGLIEHYHMCGFLNDPEKAFERLCYEKVQDDEQFKGLLEMFIQGSPKIPVNRMLPNMPGAERIVYDRARDELNSMKGGKQDKHTPEQYAKARKAVNSRILAESKAGHLPDTTGWLDQELAKLNGSAA